MRDWGDGTDPQQKNADGKAGSDPINHPAHYTTRDLEVWDAIVGLGCGYLDGNVVKYLARFRHKGDPLGDLHKARAYIDKLIEETEKEK